MFDLVISNAKIYDGTGTPFFRANIGIKDGKIALITRQSLLGSKHIDAKGLSLCPGFIDPHGHADNLLLQEPFQRAKIEQGITTSIGGLCGESQAPSALPDGSVCRFSQYLDNLSTIQIGANLAMMVGGGAIRSAAMGYSSEKPSCTQMGFMKELLHDAMQAGALGISFALVYPPCSYYDADDMIELCKVVAQYDGFATFHLRNEGTHLYEAVDEAIHIARNSGCRLILSHHKAVHEPNWNKTSVSLGMIDRAAEEGIEIFADAHPYTAMSAGLRMYIPQKLHAMGLERLTELSGTKNGRKQLVQAVEESVSSGSAHYKPTDPPRAYVLDSPSHPEYNGHRVEEIAQKRGCRFAEAVIDLLHDDSMQTIGMHVDIMNQEDVNRVLKHPRVMPCTDGSLILPGVACHPRVRGSFPRFLGRMCIQGGLMPIETAIMKMTYLPARVYGFHEKGLIRESMDADLVLFDPIHLCDHATVEDCTKPNTGLNYVILNGSIVAENGSMRNIRNGKILRTQRWSSEETISC